MKLKLHTDLSLVALGHPAHILIPFIGMMDYEQQSDQVLLGRFVEYQQKGKGFLELTSLSECDACLFPIHWDVFQTENNQHPQIRLFFEQAEASGKPIIIFAGYDVGNINIPVKNAIIFSGAVDRSAKPGNVHSWPHFFEDFIERYNRGKLTVREKKERATIGFCGYAPPLNVSWGREKIVGLAKLIANYTGLLQKKYPGKISHSYRARAIVGLNRSRKIIPNFRLKSNFAFGPQGQLNTGNTTETNNEFRGNFVKNIIDSDYTLCVRGIGNNSVRFFETLCCGRIPVFVDTDSSLPFEDFINWKELCVWVEEKDIDRIDEVVSRFHSNISPADFENLQIKLRNIWEQYLSPVGFFSHLHLFINHQPS